MNEKQFLIGQVVQFKDATDIQGNYSYYDRPLNNCTAKILKYYNYRKELNGYDIEIEIINGDKSCDRLYLNENDFINAFPVKFKPGQEVIVPENPILYFGGEIKERTIGIIVEFRGYDKKANTYKYSVDLPSKDECWTLLETEIEAPMFMKIKKKEQLTFIK
jgi:hypothetical protein